MATGRGHSAWVGVIHVVSVIGADQKHCPVVLEAAASTSGGMLSLSVDVDERERRQCQFEPVSRAGAGWWRCRDATWSLEVACSAATIGAAVKASESGAGAPSW